jgi:hypothetical protein
MYTKINNSVVIFLLAALLGPAGFSTQLLIAQSTRPSTQKEIRVVDPVNPTNGNIGLRVATGTSSYTMVLPAIAPATNQLLSVNSIVAGTATLGWVTPTAGSGTGANGQVTFWSGVNTQAGSNDLFWDNGAKKLGIGTSSPGAKLSINEATNANVELTMTARGGDNRTTQFTFGVKNASSSTIGAAIGSDGTKSGGLILNGTTNNIATAAPQVYISPAGELFVNPTFSGGGTLTDNGNYRIQINGDLYATSARFTNVSNSGYFRSLSVTNDGTLTTSTSDRRMKKNIETIPHALEKVMALRGVTFNWKDSSMPKRMMGMIAQEVLPIVPELVFQNEQDGYYGINYGESAGLLIEAIKEQQKIIQELSKVVAKQGQEMQVLIKEVSLIKQQLKSKL